MLLVGGCASEADDLRAIDAVTVIEHDQVVVVTHCRDGARLSAEETDSAVRLSFRATSATKGDCANFLCVRLQRPVGDRNLIDDSTGRPLPMNGSMPFNGC